MERDSLIYWRDKYEREEDIYVKGDEEELRAKFQKRRYITKADLVKIIKWKFQERLIGRQKRVLKLLEGIDDRFIRSLSRLAFETEDDETRIRLFCTIKGIGPAITSVILAFYDPDNYGVFDIHAWRELFGEEPKGLFSNINHLIHFFEKLREISRKVNLPCRDVEKALFKKNYDESKA